MKIIKIIIICSMLLGLTACNKSDDSDISTSKEAVTENEEEITEYERDTTAGEIKYITLEEMEAMIEKKESFPVILSTTYCLYCRDFHSVFDEYIKTHHVVMYEVVLDNENRS